MATATKDPVGEKIQTFKDFLGKHRDMIARALPRTFTNEERDRFFIVAMGAYSSDKGLQKCTTVSVVRSIMIGAQLGLEVQGPLHQAYLVPFWNKHVRQPDGQQGGFEATLITGYKGLIALIMRTGLFSQINARLVRKGEDFHIEYGTNQFIKHIPALEGNPDEEHDIRGAYMVAYMKDGSMPYAEWMTAAQIEAIRNGSKAGQDGPWINYYGQMARKTVIRRGANYLPLSPIKELAIATAIEDAAERQEGITPVMGLLELPEPLIEGDGLMADIQAKKTSQVAEKVAAKVQQQRAKSAPQATQTQPQAPKPTEPPAEQPQGPAEQVPGTVKTPLGQFLTISGYIEAVEKRGPKYAVKFDNEKEYFSFNNEITLRANQARDNKEQVTLYYEESQEYGRVIIRIKNVAEP